jgi:DNA-directed RNA polymerase specialized sigma24 family protein
MSFAAEREALFESEYKRMAFMHRRVVAAMLQPKLIAVRARELAQDVVQEAWLIAWQKGEDLMSIVAGDAPKCSLATYVGAVCKYLVWNLRRRVINREPDQLEEHPLTNRFTSRDPDPVAHRLAEQLLATLPSDRRSLMRLKYWEGLTAEEMAERLGRPRRLLENQTAWIWKCLAETANGETHRTYNMTGKRARATPATQLIPASALSR